MQQKENNKINNLNIDPNINYGQFCLIDLKIKGVHFLYLLKTFFYIKTFFNKFSFSYSFLPKKNKQLVILRSPFIYKYSRLKFNFTTHSAVVRLKFFNFFENKFLINFLINRHIILFLKNASAYTLKKKLLSYFF